MRTTFNRLMSSTATETGTVALPEGSADAPILNDVQAEAAKKRVLTFASQLDKSEAFLDHIKEAFVAKGVLQYATVQCVLDLLDIFGEEVLQTWPIVGSDNPNNPDKYTIMVTVGGERKERKTDFFTELVANLSRNRANVNIVAAVKEAADDPSKTSHKEVSKMLNKEDRIVAADLAKQEISLSVSTVRNAMKFLQTSWSFDKLDHVKWSFLQDAVKGPDGKVIMDPIIGDDGKPTGEKEVRTAPRRTPKPVKVSNVHESSQFVCLSVGSFTGLDVEKIIAFGGTFDDFIKARKRETGEDGEDNHDDANNVEVSNPATFESAFAGIAHYMGDPGKTAFTVKRLDAAIKSGKTDDIADLAGSMQAVYAELAGLQSRFDKVLEIAAANKKKTAA